ncbi:mannose-6-phosphate isomerase, class I [Microbacterium schleiferi]|uniref:mannose-6-phosphate isomerase, class I n=1 Tax=Microbacterium schleiferi TaxID=69362 RepID=UPI001D17B86E|nr:mannose-6-phosphate isomerase, class I [Microbacterium schleiferi]MCC4267068.1 mannose-6-phosphate isomerase, class I [Microbacterium schleiferi]
MLVPLMNTPRDYAWGSTTLIAELEGRTPTGAPEAEVWFGDHPGHPARVPDGRTLGEWLASGDAPEGTPERLPYLLKILAAGSPLSIQAHPSKAQAEEGFAREEAAGTPRDAATRTYRDANHKPEIIVALSDRFLALAGLRELAATRRLLDAVGEATAPLRAVLDSHPDDADALAAALIWILSPAAGAQVSEIIAAATDAASDEFRDELELVRHLQSHYPGDPGIVVAMLLNLVILRRGQGVFVPAGVLHAYIEGLGVEIMAASDNVLRGGLTPKHIDVAELTAILDPRPGPAPVLDPAAGTARTFTGGVPDFVLTQVTADPSAAVEVRMNGIAIAVATSGEVEITGADTQDRLTLRPGSAALITPNEGSVSISGTGEVFIAEPGQ